MIIDSSHADTQNDLMDEIRIDECNITLIAGLATQSDRQMQCNAMQRGNCAPSDEMDE